MRLDPLGKVPGLDPQGKILLKVPVMPPSGILGAQMRCVGNCQPLVRQDASPLLPEELSPHIRIQNCDLRPRRLTPQRYQVHQAQTEFFADVVVCIFSDLSWFDRSIKTISRYTIGVGYRWAHFAEILFGMSCA